MSWSMYRLLGIFGINSTLITCNGGSKAYIYITCIFIFGVTYVQN